MKPLRASIGKTGLIAVVCASIVCFSASSEIRADEDEKATAHQLEIRNVGEVSEYLRIRVPKNTRANDDLVLIYVNPKSGKKLEDIFVMPAGKIDEAVSETLKKWKGFGLDAGEVHQPGSTFNNGAFDVVAASNSLKKVGVYAFTQLTDTKTSKRAGAACTYFNVLSWGTEKADEVEIRLPEAPGGSMERYLPKKCELFVLLVGKDGTWHAFGAITLDRK